MHWRRRPGPSTPVGAFRRSSKSWVATRETQSGDTHVGVSVSHRAARVETLAATDDVVRRLDEKQYELGQDRAVHSGRQSRLACWGAIFDPEAQSLAREQLVDDHESRTLQTRRVPQW